MKNIINTLELERLLTERDSSIFTNDLNQLSDYLNNRVKSSSFVVLGGGGTIGQSVVKQILRRNPRKLHVIDINENALTELTRDLRSSNVKFQSDYRTIVCDIGSQIFQTYLYSEPAFDFILNFTALKHVRSERDPYSLARMIEVNILNTIKTLNFAQDLGVKNYFCVSTDKATNPTNLMGASKRIMELFLMRHASEVSISTARFANVAFSDGSLPFGFLKRLEKKQPLTVPIDIKRYFITREEAGELCLMSCLLGENMEIFFPKQTSTLYAKGFYEIAIALLNEFNLKPIECFSEVDAKNLMSQVNLKKEWPLLISKTDTTGEKNIEEFFTHDERVNFDKFSSVGIIKPEANIDRDLLHHFELNTSDLEVLSRYNKSQVIKLFETLLPNFNHLETGKNLEGKM